MPVAPHPKFHYEPASGASSPQVRIISVCDDTSSDLRALAGCVHGQSFQAWEWLILYAGADPVAAEQLAQLAAGDPRVGVVTCSPQTLDAQLRHSMADTPCEYLCRVDARSLLEPTFLEKSLWVLATNANIAFCSAYSLLGGDPRQTWTSGFEQGSKFLEENFCGGTFVIKKSAYVTAGGYSDGLARAYGDWDLWLKCARLGKWGYTIPEPLILYASGEQAKPFQPAPGAEFQAFRKYLHDRYGDLRRHFPRGGLAPLLPYENVIDESPVANCLARRQGARRLLLVLPWLVVGGAERVILDILHYLTGIGYEITIVTTLPTAQHGWAESFARYTPDIFLLEHFLRLPDTAPFLVYLIKSRQIDTVLINNSYLGYQLLPYLRSHCLEVTFADYSHAEQEYWKNGGYPRCAAAYQELLDLNITGSRHVKEWMVARGAEPDRIEVCYTNVDTERWQPDRAARERTRARFGVPEEVTLIIFVGRLAAEKRPHLVPQIVQGLRQAMSGAFLCLMLGDGPERNTVEHQVRSLGVGQSLRLLGRVTDDDLHDIMAAADVLLLPSQSEGIAVAIFEAMAMGLVPVSALVGGQAELVTPDCGALVPPGPDELAEYIRALRLLVEQPDLRRAMGAAARQRVATYFPLSALGPRVAELLEQADANRRTAPRPTVPRGLARESAVQAVEQTRLERLLDDLWHQRESWKANPHPHPSVTVPPPPVSRRRRIARYLKFKTSGWYSWGLAHGMDWLVPLQQRVVIWAKKHGW
jgi:glycosyltransferase involved in cell wall biosynthesis